MTFAKDIDGGVTRPEFSHLFSSTAMTSPSMLASGGDGGGEVCTSPPPFPSNFLNRKLKLKTDSGWVNPPQMNRGQFDRLIRKLEPTDVYFSASWFLNPQSIDRNIPIVLGSDLIIDQDRVDYSEVLKVQDVIVRHYGMKPFYTILTNPVTGNYQTNFGAIRIELEQDYRKRIKQIEKFKKDVFHSLEGCVFDPLGDIKRVFRLPYSWRKYEGKWYIVQPKIHPIDKGQVMASPKTSMPLLASSFYITNRVGNRFFPLLHYKHQEFSKIINDASRLKDTYELGDYCLFVSKIDSYVTFNSLISKRRCEKIMKNSKCE